MRIASGTTDQYVYFVAVDSTDLKTRETGLTSFTVYRSRNGAAAAAMTTPTVNETDATNMPGVYELLLDEDTTIAAGNSTEEMALHITQASMAPVTRVIELYRPTVTEGNTLDVTSGGAAGIDWGNVENQASTVDLSDTAINLCDTTTDVTNQVDAGVSAWNGVSLSTTNPLPNAAAGSNGGLPVGDSSGRVNVGQIESIDATDQINTACGAAMQTLNLDQLLQTAVVPASVANNSVIAKMVSASATADWDDFVNTTDSMQAIRDKLTDIETDTAEIGTAGAGLTNIDLPNQTMDITGNLSGSVGSVTGTIGGIAGTITTLDGLDTAQDSQHATTQSNIAALNDVSTAEVNAEVVDVLKTDTSTLPGQEAPTATPTIEEMLTYLYKFLRNKVETTTSETRVYDDAGSTIDHKATVSDAASVFTRGEFGTGP